MWRLHRGTAVCDRVAFDSTGERVAVGDTEGRITVFRLPETTPRWRFGGHSETIRFLAFHGDDVISASADGTGRRWGAPATPQAARDLLAERTDACLTAARRVKWLGEAGGRAQSPQRACERRWTCAIP